MLLVLQIRASDGDQLEAWGWRIPFFIGAICAVVALYLRRNLVETEAFTGQRTPQTESLMRQLLRHPREILIVVGPDHGRHRRRSTPTPPTCRNSWSTPSSSARWIPPGLGGGAVPRS
jgi:MFS family permease